MKIYLSFLFSFLICNSSLAAIYGKDDRKDLVSHPRLAPVARAIAVQVPSFLFTENEDGTYSIPQEDISPLWDSPEVNACPEERFALQPVIGGCTGFLVTPTILATAGHCTIHNRVVKNEKTSFCESFSWYFGYAKFDSVTPNGQNIPAQQIYRCKKVIYGENLMRDNFDTGVFSNDFALIELDRPVTYAWPLKISSNTSTLPSLVYTIGHPSGLPAKHSGIGPAYETGHTNYFAARLDTQGGNSGGPVFNQANEVVGVLISGHQIDYYQDTKRGCYKANHCDKNDENCNEDTTLSQKLNYITPIKMLTEHLPESSIEESFISSLLSALR